MKRTLIVLASLALSFSLIACKKKNAKKKNQKLTKKTKRSTPKKVTIPKNYLVAFQALPKQFESKSNSITPEKVALGRMLYFDKRLSKNHDVSCNSCHGLKTFGVDNKPVSEGHKKQTGDRNSPTVYNSAGHFVQFWDGRSPNIEHQAQQPILNPVEMAMPNAKQVVKVLKSIPGYVAAFKKAFPKDKDPVNYKNLGQAIGAFERKLVTPSRWDTYLKGDKKALTSKEKQGFVTFVKSGCLTCHSGALVGGHMYQKLGLLKPWPGNKDLGRFKATKNAAHKYFFKVPSLRNIEKTGPYLHDGSIKSLHKVVSMMAEYQAGKKLKKGEVDSIVVWLKTLTGKIPTKYIQEPTLPASSKKTPKPDPS